MEEKRKKEQKSNINREHMYFHWVESHLDKHDALNYMQIMLYIGKGI